MNPQKELLVGRLAWIEAYLAHYLEPAAVFAALRVDPLVFETLWEDLRQTLVAERARGDLELSSRFGHEIMRARTILVARKLTLDDVVVALAVRPLDDLALPDVVLA